VGYQRAKDLFCLIFTSWQLESKYRQLYQENDGLDIYLKNGKTMETSFLKRSSLKLCTASLLHEVPEVAELSVNNNKLLSIVELGVISFSL